MTTALDIFNDDETGKKFQIDIMKSAYTIFKNPDDKERFFTALERSIKANPALANPQVFPDVMIAARELAKGGLIPDGVQSAIVPRRKKGALVMTATPMVQGRRDVLARAGAISSAFANCVYEKEIAGEKGAFFEIDLGKQEVSHKPYMFGDKGALVGVYAVVESQYFPRKIKFISKHDLDTFHRPSHADAKSVWGTNYQAMAKKSALGAVFKEIPLDFPGASDTSLIALRDMESELAGSEEVVDVAETPAEAIENKPAPSAAEDFLEPPKEELKVGVDKGIDETGELLEAQKPADKTRGDRLARAWGVTCSVMRGEYGEDMFNRIFKGLTIYEFGGIVYIKVVDAVKASHINTLYFDRIHKLLTSGYRECEIRILFMADDSYDKTKPIAVKNAPNDSVYFAKGKSYICYEHAESGDLSNFSLCADSFNEYDAGINAVLSFNESKMEVASEGKEIDFEGSPLKFNVKKIVKSKDGKPFIWFSVNGVDYVLFENDVLIYEE